MQDARQSSNLPSSTVFFIFSSTSCAYRENNKREMGGKVSYIYIQYVRGVSFYTLGERLG